MSTIQNVVHAASVHKPPIKERMAVNKNHPEVIARCVGERKEPSKSAVDRFITIYLEMVKDNQKKTS